VIAFSVWARLEKSFQHKLVDKTGLQCKFELGRGMKVGFIKGGTMFLARLSERNVIVYVIFEFAGLLLKRACLRKYFSFKKSTVH
jgi:hypothetical protein